MPLSLLNNRITLSTFRGLINSCISAVNTLVTQMITVQSNVATNTADILALQSSVGGQFLYTFKKVTGEYQLVNADINSVIQITNGVGSNFKLVNTTGLSNFAIGASFIIHNSTTSLGHITIATTESSGLDGSNDIAIGKSAFIVVTEVNSYTRLPFT